MIFWPTKQPVEVIDYGMDWEPVLAALADDTILTSIWARVSGDVEFFAGSISAGAKRTNIRLRGGTDNVEHVLRNTITTAGGYTLTKTAFIKTKTLD